MNKSDRKFSVGDFVYVKTVRKYGEILDIIKTPSGRIGYRLDIDYLTYFEEELEPTNTYEQDAKKFVAYITKTYCQRKRKIIYFELFQNTYEAIELVIYIDDKTNQDEYVETDLIKKVAELEKQKAIVVKQEIEMGKIKFVLKKENKEICDKSQQTFDSLLLEAEIVTLKSLIDYYLEQLHNTNDPTQKEHYKKALIRIADQLKQLEYF